MGLKEYYLEHFYILIILAFIKGAKIQKIMQLFENESLHSKFLFEL